MTAAKDRGRLRELASRWMDIARAPEMEERKRLWRDVKDLKARKPMILIETSSIEDFLKEGQIQCSDAFLRNIEKNLLTSIVQYENLGDDIVLEPYFRLEWQIDISDYGVQIAEEHAADAHSKSLGLKYNHPIRVPEDINRLRNRKYLVRRDESLDSLYRLQDIFRDILPVRIGNYAEIYGVPGCAPYLGVNFICITYELFKLIGNNNLMIWPYDYPGDLHALSGFLTEDRMNFFIWLEREGLLDFNTDNQGAGPGSYGYCSRLPPAETQRPAKLIDCWGRAESQESAMMSAGMFSEFFLPYLKTVSGMFGLLYYGCCERLDDRWEYIRDAIPNIRAVSVSTWSNPSIMAEMLGKDYVYSGKPNPAFISGERPMRDMLEKDLKNTYAAAKACNTELIFRDIYRINGDIARLSDWVEMAKRIFGM